MKYIDSEWYDVNDFLPGDSDWKVVRCINEDEEDFYFMAGYCIEENNWDLFNDEYNEKMQVTHWCNRPKVLYEHKFIKKDDRK